MPGMPYWSSVSPHTGRGTQHTFAGTFPFLFFFCCPDSEKYYTIDGKLPQYKGFDELSDIFKTKDGYVRLHTNFPQFVFPPFSHRRKPGLICPSLR